MQPLPKQVNPTLRGRHVLRWSAPAALNVVIAFRNIGDILNIATSATTAYQLYPDVVKIHRVSIYGAPTTTGVASTVSVEFVGTTAGSAGQNQRITDTQVGTARGPVVHAVPRDQAALFQSSGSSASAFELQTSTAGAIVELVYSGVADSQAGVGAVAAAPVAASTGALYQRGLDGSATAGSNFVSLGLPQD